MLKRRHVIFRTTADATRARALLRAQVKPGRAGAGDVVGALQDTLRTDDAPFRGEVDGAGFGLTRRVRGRRVLVQLEGTLVEKPDGTTEVRASMAPPATLTAGLYGGTLAGVVVALVMALTGGPAVVPAALALALVAGVVIGGRLYEREVSQTFRALRDAIPENAGALAPVAEAQAAPVIPDVRAAVKEGPQH